MVQKRRVRVDGKPRERREAPSDGASRRVSAPRRHPAAELWPHVEVDELLVDLRTAEFGETSVSYAAAPAAPAFPRNIRAAAAAAPRPLVSAE